MKIKYFLFLFLFCVSLISFGQTDEKQLEPFSNGVHFGFRDSLTKRIAIMPVYHGAGFFYGRFAKVKVNNKWGVINKNGTNIVDAKYDSILMLRNNIFLCYIGEQCCFIDDENKEIGCYSNFLKLEDNDSRLPNPGHELIANSRFGNSLLYVVNNGGQYLNLIKSDTLKVIQETHTTKYVIEKKSFPYIKGGKFYLLNDFGMPLFVEGADEIKCVFKIYKYEDSKNYSQQLQSISNDKEMTLSGRRFADFSKPVFVKNKGKWRVIDIKGRKCSNRLYDKVDISQSGELHASSNGKKYLISDEGKETAEIK